MGEEETGAEDVRIHVRTIDELPIALRNARIEHGITQKRMADLCDVTQQTISAIESGVMEPNLRLLIRIQHALGERLLIGDTGE